MSEQKNASRIEITVKAMAKGGCLVIRPNNLDYELVIPANSNDEFRQLLKMLITLSKNLENSNE